MVICVKSRLDLQNQTRYFPMNKQDTV